MLISSVVSSQSFYFKCYDNTELLEITEMFFSDAKLDIEDYDVSINFYYNPDSNVGGSADFCFAENPNKTIILINKYIWDEHLNTDLKKYFVVYHELGHGILNLAHVCLKKEIMATGTCEGDFSFPSAFPVANATEFLGAKAKMFAGIYQIYYDCNSNKGSTLIKDVFNN